MKYRRSNFHRNLSVPKGKKLFMHRTADGLLKCVFNDGNSSMELGTITDKIVADTLFLQYLAGPNPSSEPARKSTVETFNKLAILAEDL